MNMSAYVYINVYELKCVCIYIHTCMHAIIHYNTLQYITLHYITLHYIALYCITYIQIYQCIRMLRQTI